MIPLTPLLFLAIVVHPCTESKGEPHIKDGPKTIDPKLVKRVEPIFTEKAIKAGIPPSRLLLTIIVPVQGPACDIEVVSPIGFGLEESAIEAVREWHFQPAIQGGKPVAMKATVQVNFVYTTRKFISGEEANRTLYNRALRDFDQPDSRAAAIETMEKLSKEKYPPADAFLAYELYRGKDMPADAKRALALAERAKKKNNGYAKYALALISLEGSIVPKDEALGLKLMKEASAERVAVAQLWLAQHAENKDAAHEYYKLCAARLIQCQQGLSATSGSVPGKTQQ
jgi:hypothetical protein